MRTTNRRITFEYTLISGVNDGLGDARALAVRLRGLLSHVNIIPWNAVDGLPFQPSSRVRVAAFRDALVAAGLPVTVRDTKGSAIQAACGQLKTATMRAPGTTLRPLPVATA